jgi:hypothetical protein
MAITAKVAVARKQQTAAGTDGETDLVFSADYADGRNKEWAKYTPSLELRMRVKNSVAEKFDLGQAFVLTFELAED